MAYVDGFVLPVPKKNLAAYKRMARKFAAVIKDLGATEYHEAISDDVKPGKLTSFPQSVKLKAGEVVVFSWVIYPSKALRNKANKAMMKDPRLEGMMDPKTLPFDGKRMIYGGFKPFISL